MMITHRHDDNGGIVIAKYPANESQLVLYPNLLVRYPAE
jgi:hypothetical protein